MAYVFLFLKTKIINMTFKSYSNIVDYLFGIRRRCGEVEIKLGM